LLKKYLKNLYFFDRRFIYYSLNGLIGASLEFVSFLFIINFFNIVPIYANSLSYLIGCLYAASINLSLVFKKLYVSSLLKYLFVVFIATLINIILFQIALIFLNHILLIKFSVICFMALLQFAVLKKIL